MSDIIQNVARYIGNRLREPSTYPALILVGTAYGAHLSPDEERAIVVVGMFVAGLIGAILPDRVQSNTRKEDKPEEKPNENV